MKPKESVGSGGIARRALQPPASVGLAPAMSRALDVIADRWSMWLLVVLDPSHGARFTDLAAAPGLSRRVLTERLQRLRSAGWIEAVPYARRPLRHRYHLTDRGRAVRDACLVMVQLAAGGGSITGPSGSREHPAVRLLERNPVEAQRILDATIAPLVRYDEQYRTQLVGTLRTYLECDASTSVAAARLHAHRHTIRYRLVRVRELTGLDVDIQTDRERLALGLQSLRLSAG
jgi:DNA-binding HxlR family transcriptional regulator